MKGSGLNTIGGTAHCSAGCSKRVSGRPRASGRPAADGLSYTRTVDVTSRILLVPKGDSLGPLFGTPGHVPNFRGFSSMRQALPRLRWLTLSYTDSACLRLVVLPIYSRPNPPVSTSGFSDPPASPD